jgi:hypothetical protein
MLVWGLVLGGLFVATTIVLVHRVALKGASSQNGPALPLTPAARVPSEPERKLVTVPADTARVSTGATGMPAATDAGTESRDAVRSTRPKRAKMREAPKADKAVSGGLWIE